VFDPQGTRVLILGAGGAARAALAALCTNGAASVTIANRTAERGEELQNTFAAIFPDVDIRLSSLDILQAGAELENVDLLVNTTSVGMNSTTFVGVDLTSMKPDARVYDMVYTPAITPLLAAAGKRGLRSANGVGMLAAQGEAAFSIWTGRRPPAGGMKKRLMQALVGK